MIKQNHEIWFLFIVISQNVIFKMYIQSIFHICYWFIRCYFFAKTKIDIEIYNLSTIKNLINCFFTKIDFIFIMIIRCYFISMNFFWLFHCKYGDLRRKNPTELDLQQSKKFSCECIQWLDEHICEWSN